MFHFNWYRVPGYRSSGVRPGEFRRIACFDVGVLSDSILDSIVDKPIGFGFAVDLSQPRVSHEWELNPDLTKILGAKPVEFMIPAHLRKLGEVLCPFPSNLSLPLANYKSGSHGITQVRTSAEIRFKKVLGALLFAANVWHREFAAAQAKFNNVGDLPPDRNTNKDMGFVALGYAIALAGDYISETERVKSVAETKRLAGLKPFDKTDPSVKPKKRVVPEPMEEAANIHKEQKFIGAARKALKTSMNQSPGSVSVTVPGLRNYGRGQRGRTVRFNDLPPRDTNGRFQAQQQSQQSQKPDGVGEGIASRGRAARGGRGGK